MSDIKRLSSPFGLIPSQTRTTLPRSICNCDDNDENDFGMAPECAFVCDPSRHLDQPKHKTTQKRDSHLRTKTKTKRAKH
jgi:hypothetical protein